MPTRLGGLAAALLLGAGCGTPAPGPGAPVDALVEAADVAAEVGLADGSRPDESAGPEAPDAPVARDAPAADQGSGDAPRDGAPVDAPASDAPTTCVAQIVILGRGGTTSSCSFKVSSAIPRDRVNLTFGGGRLCQQGSNNCTPRGGWFWFGDEVALCDATCLSWEDSGANLVLEAGCPSESCFVACRQEGGPCGDGINGCCAGWRCSGGTCAACVRGGQACTAASDCCAGSCQGGLCVGGLGSPCATQGGCAQGECRDGRCQCAVDQILCNSGCVSYTDPKNCRGCGNVCAAGRVCTAAGGCVCDPQSGLPDDCNGTCVDKATDRTNCGFCSFTCPRLDQVCVAGHCGCPAGQTDCNGGCYDTSTSQNHCGMCNRGCPATTEVCNAGTCVCAPGLTRCSGACVNLQTSKLNCGTCGNGCPGNKTCNGGSCG
jgi:hypothetical protein